MSVDVGNLTDAAVFLGDRQVRYREAMRQDQVALLWVPPSATDGVLYQLTTRVPPAQGANPEYLGVSRVVVAVDNLDSALAAYRRCFGLEQTGEMVSDRLGFSGAELHIPDAPGSDSIVLAVATNSSGPFADRLSSDGPGIFQFTIDVRDLSAELRRLADSEVPVVTEGGQPPTMAWIDPAALRGVRVELRQPA